MHPYPSLINAQTPLVCTIISSMPAILPPLLEARQVRGGIEDKHSTDVQSTKLLRASVRVFSLQVSHAPRSLECLFLKPNP